MIPLALDVRSDAIRPFVTRLAASGAGPQESELRGRRSGSSLWSGGAGLFEVADKGLELDGDIVLVDPGTGRLERLIRSQSAHNTLLVTEQCDQLCVMCSQPPKKSHQDRFALLTQACLLAPEAMTIGISGGEPTLHMEPLLAMVADVIDQRPDLSFHILSNGQHFTLEHLPRLRRPAFKQIAWGIPLYSAEPSVHDAVVAKIGAFERLMRSFQVLLLAGARIELRTVLMRANLEGLDTLARFVVQHLPQIEQWSLMGLENIGFARNRWDELALCLPDDFAPIGAALDWTALHGVPARLFNLPLCSLPEDYRTFAVASISDWKRRFGPRCGSCRAQVDCSGFFEWHPDELVNKAQPI